ncbi:MAG: thioredoxin family protein [Actinomycetia bacterium]|nr:thioredoxin family protein [Actinomycetes bacterium]
MVDRLKPEYEGKVEFRLYNVDTSTEGQELANKLGAKYVPTFVFVNADGSVALMEAGALPEDRLRKELDALK